MRSFTFISSTTSERERHRYKLVDVVGINFVKLCLALLYDSVQKGKTLHSMEFLF